MFYLKENQSKLPMFGYTVSKKNFLIDSVQVRFILVRVHARDEQILVFQLYFKKNL